MGVSGSRVPSPRVEGRDAGVLVVPGAVDGLGHGGHFFITEGLDGLHILDGDDRVTFYVGVF